MNKFFQKFIALIVILAMISSLGLNIFLYKPKQAKALDAGGSWATFTQGLLGNIKELSLDAIAKAIARSMMVKIQNDLIRWAQGGFSDENKPFAMMSWKEELLDSLNIASAKFINEFNLTSLCVPIKFTLEGELGGLGLTAYPSHLPSYREYAACTMADVVENVEKFWKNPSIGVYGWDAWSALAQPPNNIFGAVLLAVERRTQIESEEIADKAKEVETGGGYLNEAICTEDQVDACKKSCHEKHFATDPETAQALLECLQSCEKSSLGACVNKQVTNLGSTVKSSIDKTIGSDIDWLISADEITELVGIFFSALLNKAIHGISGLVAQPSYKAPEYKEEYGYYEASRKSITPSLREDLRSQVQSAIFKNLGQMNRRTIQSAGEEKKKQMRIEQMAESLPELLEGEVQHLYTGLQMVNLKPDYKVLDPPNAPFKVYGSAWDEIPFAQYPSKCAGLTKEFGDNLTCKQITTKLPYELEISNINSICTTTCLARINQYREECGKTLESCLSGCNVTLLGEDLEKINKCENECHNGYKNCENEAISKAIIDGKCLLTLAPGPGPGPGPEEPKKPEIEKPMFTLVQPVIPFEEITSSKLGVGLGAELEPGELEPEPILPPELPKPNPKSIDSAKTCLEGATLIQKTKNRCNDCLKAAQEQCEAKTDPDLKNICIKNVCNNFEGIEGGEMPEILDGLDFYKRCSAIEKKDACYVCLKEYFVPATYCHQILDYMSQAFVKYPAVVFIEDYENSWVVQVANVITWINPVAWVGKLFGLWPKDVKPENWWIGWYDADSGLENNKETPKDAISVGLICRAFPEFTYQGKDICKSWCNASDEERKDILDFEPTDADCGNRGVGNALPPGAIITAAVFKARTKCCAALLNDAKSYRACVFGEKITE